MFTLDPIPPHLCLCLREDMEREEAEHFVSEAIALAMSTDSSSGGCIRLVTCNKVREVAGTGVQ